MTQVYFQNKWMTHDQVRKVRDGEVKKAPQKAPIEEKVKTPEVVVEDSLIALREQFEAKTGQPVPNRYKNDGKWISSKLI